jgi:4-hydroxy-3-methylbut-2-enyl diphosphate reductase
MAPGYTPGVAPSRLLLAAPRGYCAGVDRAVETVERALEVADGEPVYVRKEIVHNRHVVAELARRGAIFVTSEDDVPQGATVVFSAHGVAPSVHANAAARGLRVIDATCPLVTKVHSEARHFAGRGYTIVLIGHEGHEEVEGTMGEAPAATRLVGTVEEVEQLADLGPETPLVYLTQTTLSVDETRDIIAALQARFPHIEAPKKEDICYATSNRQAAVKALVREVDLVLVIGSRNSSNSNRLVEVARDAGVPSHLIEDETAIDEAWLEDVDTVGITSGASAPESLVRRVVDWFGALGVTDVDELHAVHEDVAFNLPREIRRALPQVDAPRSSAR